VIEGHECFVYDIGVRVPDGVVIDDHRHREVRATFEGLLAGEIEADGFNKLVLHAGLTAWQANVLRCYAKFAHQIGFAFSQGYVEDTLARLSHLARLLLELFEARFDPDLDAGDRIATRCRSPTPRCSPRSTPSRRSTTTASVACSWRSSGPPCAPARTRASRPSRSSSTRR
jgi:NAD-specific glutamate dehydrogenase